MDWYGIVKSLHVVSVIAWMAGMLYLPRLFVYHADAVPGSVQSETFKVMERRLLRAIMNPAMIGTWGFGITMLVLIPDWLSRSEEPTSELQSLMRISYAVFCLKKKQT